MDVIRNEIQIHIDALETIYQTAIEGGCAYLKANPLVKTLVLGFSGGIDSLVTGLLADAVIDRMNDESKDRPYRLIGYSLPIITNEDDEIQRAKDAGMLLCQSFAEVDLSKAFMNILPSIDNSLFYELYGHDASPTHKSRVRGGNIKARLRMTFLYDKASKYNGMVLSTDNFTEYLLGFWTLHGDVGDFGFIQKLWKTEVYALAEHIGFVSDSASIENIVTETCEAVPTDGLGVSKSDLAQLLPDWTISDRAGYEFIDKILVAVVNKDNYIFAGGQTGKLPMLSLEHPVLKRHWASTFKRNNPINLDRPKFRR